MKKLLNKSSVLIVVMILTLLVSACGSNNGNTTVNQPKNNDKGNETTDGAVKQETIKLKFYAQYSGAEIAVYDAARDALKEVMPEVEIEFEVAGQDDEQKIKTYAAAGNLPDIFFASSALIQTFKNSDNLLVLDDIVAELDIESKLNESSKAMLWNEDGKSYTIPNVGQWAGLMYYNKDLFAEHNVKVPENFDEYLTAVETFSAAGITPLALFAKEKWPGLLLLDMATTGHEPGGLRKIDKGEGTFSDAAYVQAAKKIETLVAAGLLSKNAFNTTADDAKAQFTSGKAAMYVNGAWSMGSVAEVMGDSVGILYTPFSDAGQEEAVKWNVSGGGFNQGFSVAKNTKHPEVASKYAALFALEFAKQRVLLLADPNSILVEEVVPVNGLTPLQQQYADDSKNFKTMTSFAWGIENAKLKTEAEDIAQVLLSGESADKVVEKMVKAIENSRK
ncbi:MAG: extracellular solute-binding protein [Candidatus Pristimantibacillus lignocellulolyticus]|uniref:Extracellular solute-binding protein n=1 Tax=Candidatus Pristimantibacillus lignocellulolyticus TaxID=2994561 RepID=A0A9J6ZEV9_9BACL|nr:MAG: extracellular solute-binding protein [Candidatus Pristimantibacillus lignocellulolyticus]